MSQTAGRQQRGRPDALVEQSHLLFRYCGGSGAGSCLTPPAGTSAVFSFRVPKFISYNRRIIFRNSAISGLRFWIDAGNDGICAHSLGLTEYPFWVAFSDDGILTDQQILDHGIQLSGAVPYTFEVPADKLPQPVLDGGGANTDWHARIYVHVFWKLNGLMNEGGVIGVRSLDIVKHDYDIVI